MNEQTRNFAVGVTGILGLVGLAALTVLFGYVPEMLQTGYPVTVHVATTAGLTQDSRVQLNGIDIGRVKTIGLRQDTSGVEMTIQIDREQRIPADAQANVKSPPLGGSAVLLFRHEGEPDGYLATDGSAVVYADTTSMVDRLTDQIQQAIAGPAENFDQLTTQVDGLITEWQAVGRNIKTLTQPRAAADVDRGDAVGNITTMVARADERLRDVKQVVDKAQAWLGDEQLRTDVKQAVANARSTAEKADAVLGKVDKQVDTLSEESVQLIRRYVAVADDASKTISTMQELLNTTRQGKGTAGKLLNDPALYNHLDDAAKRVSDALDEMQLLIQKLKAEGVQINL